jgi:hypothetical protein
MSGSASNTTTGAEIVATVDESLLNVSLYLALVVLGLCCSGGCCFVCQERSQHTERVGAFFGALASLSFLGLFACLAAWAIVSSDPIALDDLWNNLKWDCSGIGGCWFDPATMGLFFAWVIMFAVCCLCMACAACVATSHFEVLTNIRCHDRYEKPVNEKVAAINKEPTLDDEDRLGLYWKAIAPAPTPDDTAPRTPQRSTGSDSSAAELKRRGTVTFKTPAKDFPLATFTQDASEDPITNGVVLPLRGQRGKKKPIVSAAGAHTLAMMVRMPENHKPAEREWLALYGQPTKGGMQWVFHGGGIQFGACGVPDGQVCQPRWPLDATRDIVICTTHTPGDGGFCVYVDGVLIGRSKRGACDIRIPELRVGLAPYDDDVDGTKAREAAEAAEADSAAARARGASEEEVEAARAAAQKRAEECDFGTSHLESRRNSYETAPTTRGAGQIKRFELWSHTALTAEQVAALSSSWTSALNIPKKQLAWFEDAEDTLELQEHQRVQLPPIKPYHVVEVGTRRFKPVPIHEKREEEVEALQTQVDDEKKFDHKLRSRTYVGCCCTGLLLLAAAAVCLFLWKQRMPNSSVAPLPGGNATLVGSGGNATLAAFGAIYGLHKSESRPRSADDAVEGVLSTYGFLSRNCVNASAVDAGSVSAEALRLHQDLKAVAPMGTFFFNESCLAALDASGDTCAVQKVNAFIEM